MMLNALDEPTRISAPVRLARYVGRQREIAFVRERVRAAADRDGSVVVVSASAGMGKTRLMYEALGFAAERDLAVVHVDLPLHGEASALPFGIVRALAAVGLAGPPIMASITPGEAGEVSPSTLVPIALAAVIEAAKQRPLVVALEDVHAYDDSSLGFVEALVRRVDGMAMLLLANVRTEDRGIRPGVSAALSRIESGARSYAVRLGPLPDDELGIALLEAARRRRPLTPRVRDDILARAGGNPFHAEELLRAYVDGNDRPQAPTATANVIERTAQLSPAARRLARAAAVVGRRFAVGLPARLIAMDAPARYDAYRELRDAALVRFDGEFGFFEHALAHEAILSTLLDDEARGLHAAVAAELAATGGDVVEHAVHAIAAGSADAAVLSERAGDMLLARLDATGALHFYEAALACPLPDDDRARLLEHAVGARERMATSFDADGMLGEAIAIHLRAGRFDQALHDTIDLGRLAHNAGAFQRVDTAYERARALFPSVSAERRFRALVTFALLFTMHGRPVLGSAIAREAEAAMPAPGFEAARFHRMRALVRGTSGDPTWREDAEATLAALGSDTTVARVSALNILTNAAHRFRDHDAALRYADEGLAAARALGFSDMLVEQLVIGAMIRFEAGKLQDVVPRIVEALTMRAELCDGSNGVAAYAVMTGIVLRDESLLERVDLDAMRSYVRRPLGPSSAGPNVLALSELYERDGRTSLNRALLDEFANTVVDAFGAWHPLARCARFGTGSAPARARTLLARGAETSPMPMPLGYLALFDAYAAVREKHPAVARKHGRAAAAYFAAAGLALVEAAALEAAGDRDAAATIYESCGAVYHVDRLRRSGLRGERAPGQRLSDREREIVRATVDGRTANDVAAAFFLSRRTVESHLASAYRKLGVRTRAGLRKALDADPTLLDP